MKTKTVLAHTLKEGDTIRIAEGDRKIAAIQRPEPPCVVITVFFEGHNAPFSFGVNSLQELVLEN